MVSYLRNTHARPLSRSVYLLFILTVLLDVRCPVVDAVTLDRGGPRPPDEHTEIFEDGTLIMNCSVSRAALKTVRWLQDTDEMTLNAQMKTQDPRVSLNVDFEDDSYITYSLKITGVTLSDAGTYTCSAIWHGNHPYNWGHVVAVSMKHFPQTSPLCSIQNKTEQTASCDTEQGSPEVTMAWINQETGEELVGTYNDYIDENGQQRVRNNLPLTQQLLFSRLVCTVTSEAFPQMNSSCSVGPLLEHVPSTLPPQYSISHRDHLVEEKTSANVATTMSGVLVDEQTSPNVAAIVPGVMVPFIFILLIISLIILCIVKQKKQDRDPDDWTTELTMNNKSGSDTVTGVTIETIVPYSVTTLQAEDRNITSTNRSQTILSVISNDPDWTDPSYTIPQSSDNHPTQHSHETISQYEDVEGTASNKCDHASSITQTTDNGSVDHNSLQDESNSLDDVKYMELSDDRYHYYSDPTEYDDCDCSNESHQNEPDYEYIDGRGYHPDVKKGTDVPTSSDNSSSGRNQNKSDRESSQGDKCQKHFYHSTLDTKRELPKSSVKHEDADSYAIPDDEGIIDNPFYEPFIEDKSLTGDAPYTEIESKSQPTENSNYLEII